MDLDQSRDLEHAVDAGGTDVYEVGVEHHEGQSPVALEGMLGVEVEDRLLLPVFQPPIAWNQGVVLVGQAVSRTPVVELGDGDSQPSDESPSGDLGSFRPSGDVIDNGVAYVVGNPGLGQSSPSTFF